MAKANINFNLEEIEKLASKFQSILEKSKNKSNLRNCFVQIKERIN